MGYLDGVKVSVTSTGICGPSTALFSVASCRWLRVGTVLLVLHNHESIAAGLDYKVVLDTAIDSAVKTAVEAIRLLIREETRD